MYKLFMTMCVLVNGAVECTDYNDSDQVIYQDVIQKLTDNFVAKVEEALAAKETDLMEI